MNWSQRLDQVYSRIEVGQSMVRSAVATGDPLSLPELAALELLLDAARQALEHALIDLSAR